MAKAKSSLVVLGSEGYIGSALTFDLKNDYQIFGFDLKNKQDINKESDRAKFIKKLPDNVVAVINCLIKPISGSFEEIDSKKALLSYQTNTASPLMFLREIRPRMVNYKTIWFASPIVEIPTANDYLYFLDKAIVSQLESYLKFYFEIKTIEPKVLNGGIGKHYYPLMPKRLQGKLEDVIKNVREFLND